MADTNAKIVTEFPNKVVMLEHVAIPMPDGVNLSARIWMPEDAEANPVPAILEYIPYRKRDTTRLGDDMRHHYWAGHGYASIRLDIRGTGESEGRITDEYPKSEQDDAVAALAWIADQPWCTGSIGMTGISWGGFNGLQVAARRPPALKTIITHCSTDDRYADDVHWMGGCLLTDGFFWGSGCYHLMNRPRDPAVAGEGWLDDWKGRLEEWYPVVSEIWMQHQRRDAYWEHGSVCEDYSDINIPVYAVGGWEDGYSNAVPRLLANLSSPAKGLVGPWGHKYPETGIPGPAIGFLQDSLRWWDHWLKGIDTGMMDEPAYKVYMQEFVTPDATQAHVPGRWLTEPSWPSPNIKQKTLYLGNRTLSGASGDAVKFSHSSPETLGITGGNWCPYGLGGSSPDLAIDQREDDGRSLCFDGDVLDDALPLLGAPVLKLRLAIDQPQGFVVARLCDVAPDGTSRRITFGILNLTHREGHGKVVDMVPGEWTDIEITLNDFAHTLAPGHKLRLALSTSYWPMVWPSAAPVTLQIDTETSTLDLPERAARAEDAAVAEFLPPEIAPPGAHEIIVPGQSGRTTSRDLNSGEWVTTLTEKHGTANFGEIDLDTSNGMVAAFTIREGDPLSAEALWTWRTTYDRDGDDEWHISVDTKTRLRATATEFVVDTDIDAQNKGRTIFNRSWRRRIPRDGI